MTEMSTPLTHVKADKPVITDLSRDRGGQAAQLTTVKVRGYAKSRRLGVWNLTIKETISSEVQADLAERFSKAVNAGAIFTGELKAELFSPYHNGRCLVASNALKTTGFKDPLADLFITIIEDEQAEDLSESLKKLGY